MHLYEINREERHFGFLFMTALISNGDFRTAVFQIIKDRSELGIKLSSDSFDIYAEVAIFRDHWYTLGSHLKYTEELHRKRLAVLNNILSSMSVNAEIIDKEDLFWTRQIGESKLWYPGKWDRRKIQEVESKYGIADRLLWRCRWLCNAKPDVMIQSRNEIVFIEIKVESGMGSTEEGYDQEQTQSDIIKIASRTIDWMQQARIGRITLAQLEHESGITWDEIVNLYEENKVNGEVGSEMITRHFRHMPQK